MATNKKITGAVKFFNENFALFKNGTTATASTNEDSINSILDISRYTQWESLGSNDTITETIVVTFKFEKTIDTIALLDMNFKEFEVQYWNGSSYSPFTNVYGVNNEAKSGISETDYSYDTGFYQFDPVSTLRIQITCLKTQTENAEKVLTQILSTFEIGTFQGFPRVQPESNRNETKAKALSRRYLVQKTYETTKVKITFKTHPFQNDIDIVQALFDREDPFFVYPCGGVTGADKFKIEQNNWRLKDLYNVQLTGKIKNEFEKGVYLLGVNKTITMEEHV